MTTGVQHSLKVPANILRAVDSGDFALEADRNSVLVSAPKLTVLWFRWRFSFGRSSNISFSQLSVSAKSDGQLW